MRAAGGHAGIAVVLHSPTKGFKLITHMPSDIAPILVEIKPSNDAANVDARDERLILELNLNWPTSQDPDHPSRYIVLSLASSQQFEAQLSVTC